MWTVPSFFLTMLYPSFHPPIHLTFLLPGKEFFESGNHDHDLEDVDTIWNMFKILVRNHSLLSMFYYPGE